MLATALAGGANAATSLPAELARRAAAGEVLDVIVEYDARAIDADLARRRALLPRAVADDALLRDARSRYAALKDAVDRDARVAPAPTLRDYTELPLRLKRVSSAAALSRLASHPSVRAVHENGIAQRVTAQSLALVSQPAVAAVGYGGAGTTVVVIDDGIDITNPAFGGCTAPGVPAGCRVVANVQIVATPGSSVTHGTNVSAIVAGLAGQAKVAMLNVFSSSGATFADVIAGIDWAILNRSAFNIVAINMSLGDTSHETSACSSENPFVTPVANAIAAGISVVAASGNGAYVNGTFTPGLARPACTPGVISVGAVYDANVGGLTWGGAGPGQCTDSSTQADRIACFSQSAGILTLLAPGALITAGGATLGGTSQAAPHAAGAVAILRAAFPADALATTLARLTTSGVHIADSRSGVTRPRLSLAEAARPANDAFANAVAVAGGAGSATGTNLLATLEPGEPAAGAPGARSVWWRWTAPAAGQVTLGTAGSDFTTLLAVYTGTSVSALAGVAEAAVLEGNGNSTLWFQAQPGTTYRWKIDGAAGAAGRATLNWTLNTGAQADLSATITGPGTVAAGQTISVDLSVRNAGPQVATRVVLALPLPAGISYAGGPPVCAMVQSTLRCTAAQVAASASLTWTVQLSVNDPGAGLTLSPSIASDLPDPAAANNVASLALNPTATDGDVPLPGWAIVALAALLASALRGASRPP